MRRRVSDVFFFSFCLRLRPRKSTPITDGSVKKRWNKVGRVRTNLGDVVLGRRRRFHRGLVVRSGRLFSHRGKQRSRLAQQPTGTSGGAILLMAYICQSGVWFFNRGGLGSWHRDVASWFRPLFVFFGFEICDLRRYEDFFRYEVYGFLPTSEVWRWIIIGIAFI